MAYQVKWSPEAVDDLEAIGDYISRDSPNYASIVISKILSSLDRIKKYPSSGRIVPEINNDNFREIFIYSYRVVYRISSNILLILAVIHGKQQFETFKERF